MSLKAFKSAARCPHCEQHMIPRRVGGNRYGGHTENCPKNMERATTQKPSISLFVRARFRILGREIQSCGKDFLHMMFICTNCFRFRYSNLPPQGVLCSSCGVCMHHVFSGEEIILDKYSLPKNHQRSLQKATPPRVAFFIAICADYDQDRLYLSIVRGQFWVTDILLAVARKIPRPRLGISFC